MPCWPKAVKCCGELARRTDPQQRQPRRGPEPAKEIGKLRSSPIEKIRAKEGPGLVYAPKTLFLSNLRRYFSRPRPLGTRGVKPSGDGEARGSRPDQPGLPPQFRCQSFRPRSCDAWTYRRDHDVQPLPSGALEQRSNMPTRRVFSQVSPELDL